jgi:NAD(P)-dependent dehydrogenase (short-subunit alcohol dehydrogenase family)
VAAPGTCAVVTGAASGLGLAIARALAAQGQAVLRVDRDAAALEASRADLPPGPAPSVDVAADVASLGGWQQVHGAYLDLGRPLAWLVNAAGIAVAGSVTDVPAEAWRRVLDVNLLGPVWGCQAFLPELLKQPSGRILNIASRTAFTVPPQLGPYTVSKAGLVAFTETLASELRGTGITATVACPGYFRSRLSETMQAYPPALAGLARKMVDASPREPETVAADLLAFAMRGELYAIPRGEDRLLWRFKRLAPRACLRTVARSYAEALAQEGLDGRESG